MTQLQAPQRGEGGATKSWTSQKQNQDNKVINAPREVLSRNKISHEISYKHSEVSTFHLNFSQSSTPDTWWYMEGISEESCSVSLQGQRLSEWGVRRERRLENQRRNMHRYANDIKRWKRTSTHFFIPHTFTELQWHDQNDTQIPEQQIGDKVFV